jgi:hypothetical protein
MFNELFSDADDFDTSLPEDGSVWIMVQPDMATIVRCRHIVPGVVWTWERCRNGNELDAHVASYISEYFHDRPLSKYHPCPEELVLRSEWETQSA